jgi:hypothetical protein
MEQPVRFVHIYLINMLNLVQVKQQLEICSTYPNPSCSILSQIMIILIISIIVQLCISCWSINQVIYDIYMPYNLYTPFTNGSRVSM